MFITPNLKTAIHEMIDNAESTGDWSEIRAAQDWTIGEIIGAMVISGDLESAVG